MFIIADTIHDSSPSPRRKLSALISSIRGSRINSRTGSEDSVAAHHISRSSRGSQTSGTSTHKLLRRLTSKTSGLGTSVIKRDGSVIMVKNGKIVSMREDFAKKKKKNSVIFDDVFLPDAKQKSSSMPSTPASRSKYSNLNVVHEHRKENIELKPLLSNGVYRRRSSNPEDTSDNYYEKHENKKQSLSIGKQNGHGVQPSHTENIVETVRGDNSHKTSDKLKTSPVFLFPEIGYNNDTIPRSKSDIIQNADITARDIKWSQSSNDIYNVPLLSSPEYLTIQSPIFKSSSDTDLKPSYDYHVTYKRRWKYSRDDNYKQKSKRK